MTSLELQGTRLLVTGACGGLGRAICVAAARAGASRIALAGRDEERLHALKASLLEEAATRSRTTAADGEGDNNGLSLSVHVYDQTVPAQNIALVQNVYQTMGGIDVLVCNAGITRDKMAKNLTPEAWQEVVDVNLSGPFFQSQTAIKLSTGAPAAPTAPNWTSTSAAAATATASPVQAVPLLAATAAPHKLQRIIFITSIIGHTGNLGQANYAASKAGLTGLAKTLALECARSHVTVNCIAPGFIETPMTEAMPEAARAQVRERIPLKRLGRPEEVAQAALFLMQAGYITGQTLHVNGGLAMQ